MLVMGRFFLGLLDTCLLRVTGIPATLSDIRLSHEVILSAPER